MNRSRTVVADCETLDAAPVVKRLGTVGRDGAAARINLARAGDYAQGNECSENLK